MKPYSQFVYETIQFISCRPELTYSRPYTDAEARNDSAPGVVDSSIDIAVEPNPYC